MTNSWRTSKSSSRPSHHADNTATSFKNPWPSAGAPTWTELLEGSFPLGLYNDQLRVHNKAREVKVVKPDWGEANLLERGLDKAECVVGTWLGHAGALVEVPTATKGKSVWLLFDPIFSARAGPTQYTGPSRMKKSPCEVADLPGCDAVFISHNHYDHLDLASIKSVSQRFPKARYFVPLGNRSWLTATGVPDELIDELDWWQDREYKLQGLALQALSKNTTTAEERLRFSCVPAQHNSGRAARDQGSTLWCGWVVERFLPSKDDQKSPSGTSKASRRGAIYHAGDTGYRRTAKSQVVCPAFTEIGQKFGPFDLSFVPIWRGGSLGFISYLGLRLSHHDIPSALHGSPTDAVAMHLDVQSRNTVGIHFGTFVGSENESYDAMVEFSEACESVDVTPLDDVWDAEKGRAGTIDIGDSLAVKME